MRGTSLDIPFGEDTTGGECGGSLVGEESVGSEGVRSGGAWCESVGREL